MIKYTEKKEDDFRIHKADNSNRRKECITISVGIDDSLSSINDPHFDAKDVLPFESDSIN